jgi:hypothetical protein
VDPKISHISFFAPTSLREALEGSPPSMTAA